MILDHSDRPAAAGRLGHVLSLLNDLSLRRCALDLLVASGCGLVLTFLNEDLSAFLQTSSELQGVFMNLLLLLEAEKAILLLLN